VGLPYAIRKITCNTSFIQ